MILLIIAYTSIIVYLLYRLRIKPKVIENTVLVPGLPEIIIDDIKLSSTRYIINNNQIEKISVEGIVLIDNDCYIQTTKHIEFDSNKVIISDDVPNHRYVGAYKGHTAVIEYQNNTNKFYLDRMFKYLLDMNLKSIACPEPKFVKYSKTYSSKEEAELIIQERKDKEFEENIKRLEENYKKDLDNLLNKE